MKLLKKLTALICALAMVMALAPCAFAEELPDEITGDKTIYGSNGKAGNLEVADGAVLDVLPGDGGIWPAVYVEGSLDNKGTINAGREPGPDQAPADNVIIQVNEELKNSGTITASGQNARVVATDGLEDSNDESLTNEAGGTITVNAGGNGVVRSEGDLTNDGDIFVNPGTDGMPDAAPQGNGSVAAYGKLTNNGTIVVNDGQGISEDDFLDVFAEGLENNGDITVNGGLHGTIVSNDELVNGEGASITITSGASYLGAASIVNRGEISLSGEDVEIEAGDDGDNVTNFGKITITDADGPTNYYGFQYEGASESLLSDWTQGIENNELSVVLKTNDQTNAGYTFGGWQLNGQVYQPGETAVFHITSVTNIVALWNKILEAAAPAGNNAPEKAAEQIAEFLEGLKVLDADRQELAQDTDYYRVARTTHGRLIVLFTDVQLKELPSGENLFYIITPDGAEVEYTLQIA